MDLTEAYLTANPDDTVLSSEIALENHILLAYQFGKSHVHWILHCRNEPQADHNNFVIPALPIFNRDEDFWRALCPDKDFTPVVRIPWGERNINYFRYNLYLPSRDKVVSYELLLANLRNELRNYNLDLAEMELVDVGRRMRVRNQRTLINYYHLAIGHQTAKLVLSLLRRNQPQPNSGQNASAAGLLPDLNAVPVCTTPVSSLTLAPPLSVTMVPQIPMAPAVAPPRRLSPIIQQLPLPQVPAHSWQPVGESSRMGAAGHFGLPSLVHTMYSSDRPQRHTTAPGHSPAIQPTFAAVGPGFTSSPARPSSGTEEYTSQDTCAASTRSPMAPPAPQPASPMDFALPTCQTQQPASPARRGTPCPPPHGSPPTLPRPPAASPAFPTTTLSSTAFPSSPPITFPITPPASARGCPAPLVVSPPLPSSPKAAPATHSDSTACGPALMATPVTSPIHLTSTISSTLTPSSHLNIPGTLETPLPISLAPSSPALASLASSHSTSPSPPGLVPTPTRSLRPRVSASSKFHSPSTSKEETGSLTASGNRRSTRTITRPLCYAESTLATPVTIKSSGNKRPSTDFKVSAHTHNKASLTKFKLQTINISDDDDDDNDDTSNNNDHGEDLDEDSDISTASWDDSDDNDFEMTDCMDEEESDEGDSEEASLSWQYGKELDEIDEDQEWPSQKDSKVGRQEEGGRREDDAAEEAEMEQEEEEEDLDPQPATKRRIAAPSKATHKRAKLAIPTTSSTVGRPQPENPSENMTQGMYLVSTVTKPLQATLETVKSSLAANDSFSPANQSLSPEDR